LKGVAELFVRASDLGARTIARREFEAQGIRVRAKETRARDAKEKEAKAALIAEADRIDAEVERWRTPSRDVVDGVVETLATLAPEPTDVDALADAVEKTGRLAAAALELVEVGTFLEYGTPVPTVVRASATGANASSLAATISTFCSNSSNGPKFAI
jgi:hydroxylamine reductase (hybrid-cluster protein)